ncbi:hypothetical protein [Kitasatospora cathayae]|uniref:Uncharacterized protein n=1 Tax=Kitasatospora cathayae TaxID=3004092 RepID=A0ABY7QBC3_9ACTN|nr:hypothetical protein [Kitasatospora sp. HUAS 3-15]WBP90075.1 hypothetical protein O1G21_32295 [Kitasatospora sp. HUAS 3-15]
MNVRRTWARISRWWCLNAQFSRPVRAVSPRRRAAHTEMQRWMATPGDAEALLLAVLRRSAQNP